MAKVRDMAISIALIGGFLKGTPATKCAEMPDDAKVLEWYADRAENLFWVRISSESFEEVPEGEPVPRWAPVYERA